MDPITRPMFMGSKNVKNYEIGESVDGGFFAGYISHNRNSIATHALIVAPLSSEYFQRWQNSTGLTSGIFNEYDGAPNTANMADTDHPAAYYCAGLSIGGYSDWYLPARYELEIAYFNLKPTNNYNNTPGYGDNPYAVPARTNWYSYYDPAQTSVAAFQSGGAEAFEPNFHWSSSQGDASNAWRIGFERGTQNNYNKLDYRWIRAFRKIKL